MPTATQLVINVENKPGVLAQVSSMLGAAGVNIKAFSAAEATGPGKLRLIVSDLERARAALNAENMQFEEESVLVLSLENKPGALGEVVKHLKDSHINITCGYCTPSREGRRALVVLTVSDTQKALDVLKGKSLDEF